MTNSLDLVASKVGNSRQPHKIKKSTIIGEKEDVGLKMVAFLFMNKSLKATWATRFFDENKAPWKIIPNYLTKHLGGLKFLLSCNYKFEELPLNELPPFYLNILQYREEIRHITVPKDTTTLNEIIIWNNSSIKVNGKTVYYQPWQFAKVLQNWWTS